MVESGFAPLVEGLCPLGEGLPSEANRDEGLCPLARVEGVCLLWSSRGVCPL